MDSGHIKAESLLVLVDWHTCELLGFKGTAADLLALTDPTAPPPGFVTRTMRGDLNIKRIMSVVGGDDGASGDGRSLSSYGELRLNADSPVLQIDLRLFLDGSAVEVFTSTGHALSTRLHMLQDGDRGLHLVSIGGASGYAGQAWQMNSCWAEGGEGGSEVESGAAPASAGGSGEGTASANGGVGAA